MPSKKKKYNARFPAGRIKKIMQSDEEIGKVAQAVPVIISICVFMNLPRTLELFVESLLTKTLKITNSRNAKTLSTSHMKQCIMSEQRFDFLRELVKNIPDISVAEEAANYNDDDGQSSPEDNYPDSDTPYDLSMATTSLQATRSNTSINGSHNRSPIIHNLNGSHSSGSSYSGLDLSTQVEPDFRKHLRQTVPSPLSVNQPNSKVIHHSDHMPIKLTLMRSESAPTHAGMQQQQHHQNWTIQQHHHQQGQNRQRLKNKAPASSCKDVVPSKQQKFENPPQLPTTTVTSTVTTAQPPQTAIPAPVVSFDFCNKPVVKIDYSHLSLSTSQSDGGPHSAPALSASSGSSSSFNFSPAPVINIDLTNLVTSVPPPQKNMITTTSLLPPSPNPAIATINFDGVPTPATTKITAPASACAASSSSSHRMASTTELPSPAITTITFDGIPAPLKPLAITTSPITSTIITPTQSKPSNPKATMAMPFNISNTVTKNTATIALSKNSFCELDEDYDNI